MMDHTLIKQWWNLIQSMGDIALEENASSLSNLHNSEYLLDLQPLPDLQFPIIQANDLLSRKPAFKHLGIIDILFLRKCILTKEISPELTDWAEFLLRYLEINRSTVIKKARLQFGSKPSGRMALLEMTAFVLDVYFEWDDLRYLNLALKLMDMPGIFYLGSFSKNITSKNKKLPLILIQVRMMVLRQAAIERINNG